MFAIHKSNNKKYCTYCKRDKNELDVPLKSCDWDQITIDVQIIWTKKYNKFYAHKNYNRDQCDRWQMFNEQNVVKFRNFYTAIPHNFNLRFASHHVDRY